MNVDLQQIVNELAALAGAPQVEFDTDHGRWRLYEHAIGTPAGTELLRQAVIHEEDQPLATSLVLRILEEVSDTDQAGWIDQLPAETRDYARKRALEVRILRLASAGCIDVEMVYSDLSTWSNWLQLRLAGLLTDRNCLAILSTKGRTKRIRNLATRRATSVV